eukprot:EC850423.1.p4 GENE.EC850423.1~~EC850423.1.p4  ORF type:complete len:60 (-),score=10.00 EC850423.1:270-449(-)
MSHGHVICMPPKTSIEPSFGHTAQCPARGVGSGPVVDTSHDSIVSKLSKYKSPSRDSPL